MYLPWVYCKYQTGSLGGAELSFIREKPVGDETKRWKMEDALVREMRRGCWQKG